MAHSCPDCGLCCYCGGDIDDCRFEGTPEEASCQHCPPESYEDEDQDEDDWSRWQAEQAHDDEFRP